MKSRIVVCLAAGMFLRAASCVAQTPLLNGSFESWDFVGWSLTSESGTRATEPVTRTAGVARTLASWGDGLQLGPVIAPVAGSRFLALNTRAAANFIGDHTYDTFLSQTLSLSAGMTLSGWSWFVDGDNQPLDTAWVRIRDGQGQLVASPWFETSGASLSNLTSAPTPGWNFWQWSAPAAGHYTVQLGMTTSGADNDASYAFFDGLSVHTSPVPEPATMSLALVGGLVLTILRNKKS